MNPVLTLSTARRILTQLRHDRRTVAMLLLMPSILMVLLRYVFNSEAAFDRFAPALLGIFPFVMMFLVTSITTLRERTTATLERLMALPMGKLDLLAGYAVAFGALALVQVSIVTAVSLTWLGLDLAGPVWMLFLIAVLDAVLGMALGLFVSAFARTEFQAIQFMPVVAMPQLLLCGLFVPRDEMAVLLTWLSNVLPLSYAVDAITAVTRTATVQASLLHDIGVVGGFVLLALVLGAATLRRRTP